MNNCIIKCIVSALIFFSINMVVLPIRGQDNSSRPNIIFIMVDQLRPDHLLGDSTPNLTSLAKSGINFTHAYTVSPLCEPSRNSIITGLYPSQTKIYGNQTGPISDRLRDNTFMNKLQKGGYYTALIGKHHYIDRYRTGTNLVKTDKEKIKKYGFNSVTQVVDIYEHMKNPDHTENIDAYINYLEKKGLAEKYFNNIRDGISEGVHPMKAENTEGGFTGLKARQFIDHYNRNKPFYLYISFISPHPPYVAPKKFIQTKPAETNNLIGAQTTESARKKRALYDDMITHVDSEIGKIVESLKSNYLYKNTVIIFTADHGDNLGDHGIWDKRYFYEQSVGVPLFITGKGITGRNPRIGSIASKALVSTLDIYPTIMHLSGVNYPKNEMLGKNLLDIISGSRQYLRNAVYSQLGTLAMIRTARWKMVFDPEQGGAYYLFNMINDPKELNNLAGVAGYESVTEGLTKKLLSFYIELDQSTQMKEQLRLQKVRVKGVE